jgi:serine/threonine protein kinase
MTGSSIAHYEILEKLGEGGMGIVHKARDTRLNRLVAIKFLPAGNIADEDRLRRFTKEARTASALNHPNIVTIHDIGSEGEAPFIVMEYVAGKTLDHLIPRKGMRLTESLKFAVQIADALAAATAGVIHRDVKPGNIMVTDSGLVKVLDFGLAKLAESSAETGPATATIAMEDEEVQPHTGRGVVLGTVSYMSPEQAEGKPLDARSDIFSFGALLYEMTTGQLAFRGDTKMSTISSILRDEPARAGELCADVPRDLDKIIARCLRKDPNRRFQHMSDVRVALLELKEESESGNLQTTGESPSRKMRRLPWVFAAGVLLMAAVALAVGLRLRRDEPAQSILHAVPLTSYSGQQGAPTFSPDGNQLAFPWTGDQGDITHIYVKLIGNDTPLRLTASAHRDFSPAWAPDGRSIAFIRHTGDTAAIYQISPIGGTERRVTELNADSSSRLSWSHDGTRLVASGRETPGKPERIYVITVDTGEKQMLSFGETADEFSPALSLDSRQLAFSRSTGDLMSELVVVNLDESLQPKGAARQLNTPPGLNTGAAWTTDGNEIVFQNNRAGLWRVSADSNAPARELPLDVDGVTLAAISPRGGRLAARRTFADINIWRFPISGPGKAGEPAVLIASTRIDRVMEDSYSPDGRKIAIESSRSGGPTAVWVMNADGGNPTMLFRNPGHVSGSPTWSPDARRIAFDSRTHGNPEIYSISAEGGAARRLTNHPADDVLPYWSNDGQSIYFASNRSGSFQIYKIPAGGGEPVQLTRKGGWSPRESPDGKFLYYSRRLTTGPFLAGAAKSPVLRMPVDGGEESQVAEEVFDRTWAVSTQGIWFLVPDGPRRAWLRFFDTATGRISTAAGIDKPVYTGLTLSADGRSLLYNQIDHSGTEILLIENFR